MTDRASRDTNRQGNPGEAAACRRPPQRLQKRYPMIRAMSPGLSLAFLCSLAALWQTVATFDPGGARAVVFAPWLDRTDVWARIAAADGRVAREGRWPFVIVAQPSGSDFSERIHRLGAWMELNPKIAADCNTEPNL